MPEAFRVLYVCTGNVCRSAAAQQLLLHHATVEDAVVVASAGTGALEGRGIDAPTATALTEVGVTLEPHEGLWLTEAMVRDADLVLGATTAHRDHVHRMVPATMRRAFTMREFARLGRDVEGAHGPEDRVRVVREVASMRGQVDPPEPGADDVGDPFGAGLEAARTMVAQVQVTVDATARLLGLGAGHPRC